MTIYEIDDAIRALVDEDGEIGDYEAFEALQMERDAKVENTGLWIKELLAEADAIKKERDALKEREDAAKRKAERLKELLGYALGGEKFKTARLVISWRESEAVEVTPECEAWCREHGEFLREKPPEIDKAAIKNALKQGGAVIGASLVKRQNIQIK
jgi:hypothetical protein